MTQKIPLSIGFELETQYLCPILIDKSGFIGDIDNEHPTLIDYQIWSADNTEFSLCGDQFTLSTEFAQELFSNPFIIKYIKTRKMYARKHDTDYFLINDFLQSLHNTEFINTFYKNENVSINNILTHIIHKLQKTAKNIKDFLFTNKNINEFHIIEPDYFPFKYFYLINNPDLVTNSLNRIRNKKINHLIAEKQTFDKFQMNYDNDLINQNIQYIKNDESLKNINYNCIGLYSLGSIKELMINARFVPQCTLGFPIVHSIDVMFYLYNLVKMYNSDLEMLIDFKNILDKIPYFKKHLKPLTSRNKLLLNYIFLFYYSMVTINKRKKNCIFCIRANFQILMYLLTTKEKEKIFNIIDDDIIRNSFHDIHFHQPYLSKYEMTIRQQNSDVHTLQDNQLLKLHLNPVGTKQTDNIAKEIDFLSIKIYIEFRMLNFIITSKLEKSDATLHDIIHVLK